MLRPLRRWLTRLVVPAAAMVAPAVNAQRMAPGSSPPGAPQVTTDAGTLQGSADSATGVLVFSGIPYAAPPVGSLRWRPPEPSPRWSGVRRADQLGRNCMQPQVYDDIDPFAAGVSEDCLFLNVWTAGVDAGGPPRPVMVWIHGGGFGAGFGGVRSFDK